MQKLDKRDGLTQPASPDRTIQCLVRRYRTTESTIYQLCVGLRSGSKEKRTSLLFAKKVRRATGDEFLISVNPNDMSKSSSSYVGSLRSNVLGTKFFIYDNQSPSSTTNMFDSCYYTNNFATKWLTSRWGSRPNHNVASVTYEPNIFGVYGPRKMQCTLNTIPSSALNKTPRTSSSRFPNTYSRAESAISNSKFSSSFSSLRSRSILADWSPDSFDESSDGDLLTKEKPLVLKNKAPTWHEKLECWFLNFHGRVTMFSVKNFQLVSATDPASEQQPEKEKILLQFGKIGKNLYTMDYSYPLSAFQAFSICLTAFDNKIVCDSRNMCCT